MKENCLAYRVVRHIKLRRCACRSLGIGVTGKTYQNNKYTSFKHVHKHFKVYAYYPFCTNAFVQYCFSYVFSVTDIKSLNNPQCLVSEPLPEI